MASNSALRRNTLDLVNRAPPKKPVELRYGDTLIVYIANDDSENQLEWIPLN